jgi:hypothetical protein
MSSELFEEAKLPSTFPTESWFRRSLLLTPKDGDKLYKDVSNLQLSFEQICLFTTIVDKYFDLPRHVCAMQGTPMSLYCQVCIKCMYNPELLRVPNDLQEVKPGCKPIIN